MYNIRPTTKFQKDLKRVKKRGFDIPLLTDIIKKLAAGEPLPEKNRDHQLSGDYAGCRECHITPDWLLIYEVAPTNWATIVAQKKATITSAEILASKSD